MSWTDLLVIERLVFERWGGRPVELHEAVRHLEKICRQHSWTFEKVSGLDSCASYVAYEWHDRHRNVLGWTLNTLNIVAFSSTKPEWGLPPAFSLTSGSGLHDALSAEGLLVLPEVDWLLAPIGASERAAIEDTEKGNHWEAYNLRHWKPANRAEMLFNHWD